MSGRIIDEVGIASGPSSRRHPEADPHIHRVERLPQQTLFTEIRSALKETFFSDEPLRAFRGQKCQTKFLLVLQAIFPIFRWGRSYNLKKLKGDIIAGLTIASLCVPQVKTNLHMQS